jgi:hypothetical protein
MKRSSPSTSGQDSDHAEAVNVWAEEGVQRHPSADAVVNVDHLDSEVDGLGDGEVGGDEDTDNAEFDADDQDGEDEDGDEDEGGDVEKRVRLVGYEDDEGVGGDEDDEDDEGKEDDEDNEGD